ncbi:MAG: antA/AntB antirepressor family protein [Thermonemataceae bacterium]|nr:antA/AntB antirepressor family protein [Thermonemataceae bacterium]
MQSNKKDATFPNVDAPLIRVEQNSEGKQTVSARELHQFLGVKEQFTDWFNRMKTYGFEENQDYIILQENLKKTSKSNPIDYALTLDTAKEISMLQRSDKGKQARKYFIEAEKQLRSLDIDKLASLVAQKLGVKIPTATPANENMQVSGTGKTAKKIDIEGTLHRFKTIVETLQINDQTFYFYRDILAFCGYNESAGGMYNRIQGYQQAKLAVRVGKKQLRWYLSFSGLKIFLKESQKSEAGILLYAIEQKGGVL